MARTRTTVSQVETGPEFNTLLFGGSNGSTQITETIEKKETIRIFAEKPHRSLCSYHQLPKWQKDNDFIVHGYVKETNNIWHCFDTLFFLNNESINILTHLIPGTILPIFMSIFIPYFIEHSNFIKSIPPWIIEIPNFSTTDSFDNAIFTLFFIGFSTCLSCSATFHVLKVHSHKIASMGSRLDYAGILLLIGSSLIGIIHYSLCDYPTLRLVFTSITSIIGLSALIVTWHPDFRSPQWRAIRTATFIIFAFSGLIPIFYGFFAFGFTEAVKRAGLKYVFYEAISYLCGALIYAFRFPERISPGYFDMYGNSHQIFHILVVIGAYCHFNALVASYKYAHQNTLGGTIINLLVN